MANQLVNRLHGARQMVDDLIPRQVSEIMRADRADHPQTDIGRTGAHRQFMRVGDLIIVGRKPRRVLADEIREVAPGSSRDFPQKSHILFRQQESLRLHTRPKGQEPTDQRRQEPQHEPGTGREKVRRHPAPHHPPHDPAENARQSQRYHERSHSIRGVPMHHLGGRPLEQSPMRNEPPVPDPQNGIQSEPGLVRKQRGVDDRPQEVVRRFREGESLEPLGGRRPGEGLHQRVEKHLHRNHKGGYPNHPRGDQPRSYEQRQARCGYQTPAQVVEDLPAVEPGERIRTPAPSGPGHAR